MATIETLSSLAPQLKADLNQRADRATKEQIAATIGNFLVSQGRLLIDVTSPDAVAAYLIADDDAALPICGDNGLFRKALQDTGLNPTEPVFAWTCEALSHQALRQGRSVSLERYCAYRGTTLYVSAGTSSIVVAKMGPQGVPVLTLEPNGYDGVLFAGDGCFPGWTPADHPLDFTNLEALCPNLLAPAEVPSYDAATQLFLLKSWVVGRLAGVTLPILTCIGSKGSGKSILVRAITKLFGGEAADISNQPKSVGDLFAAATSLPLYGIDNLDAQPSTWFLDAIASACTGVSLTDRRLYTNSTMYRKPVTAGLAVTTRTSLFALRPDVKDRVLPIFFDDMPDSQKKDDKELLKAVINNRNQLLTGLVHDAVRRLDTDSRAAGLPGRFQGFARLVMAETDRGRNMLEACEQAQLFSLVDPDPLLEAIVIAVSVGPLSGTPTDIVETVKVFCPIPPQGGGKRIASKLRELKPALRLHGIRVHETTTGGKTCFQIYRAGHQNPQNPQNAEQLSGENGLSSGVFPNSVDSGISALTQ